MTTTELLIALQRNGYEPYPNERTPAAAMRGAGQFCMEEWDTSAEIIFPAEQPVVNIVFNVQTKAIAFLTL
jgi:hypothetical protein